MNQQQIDPKKLEQIQKQQEQKEQVEEYKKQILQQVLTPEAKQRLANIKLVKADKAEKIEIQLCQIAQSGRLQKPITEDELIKMLEQAEGKRETQVSFKRRKLSSDSD